ncbi:hypothetical protein ACJX0J_010775 [Zea mays]
MYFIQLVPNGTPQKVAFHIINHLYMFFLSTFLAFLVFLFHQSFLVRLRFACSPRILLFKLSLLTIYMFIAYVRNSMFFVGNELCPFLLILVFAMLLFLLNICTFITYADGDRDVSLHTDCMLTAYEKNCIFFLSLLTICMFTANLVFTDLAFVDFYNFLVNNNLANFPCLGDFLHLVGGDREPNKERI